MPKKGTRSNKNKHKNKTPSSTETDKKLEDSENTSKKSINGFAEIMCEYRQAIRDDDFKTNFLFDLADKLNYNEIIIALSHAYLYPSNVLISDVDNAEDNKSVLAIDFSSEQGRKFKKTLTDVNVKNKNYQNFIQKVTAFKIVMNINDIKISLSDMFKIIQIKINSILDNSAKISQDDFDFISTIIQYHYKNFYDLDQLFCHSYFTTLYYIISNINKFPDDHFKVLLVTEFLNILLHASKQNNTVADIDKHIVLQIMHLFTVAPFFNPALLQKLDSSTMTKTEDLLKNNIFLRFLTHYDKMCNQGLLEQSNKIKNNLISLSTKSHQMSTGCLAKQNDNIIDSKTHNLYKTYHLVYQGIISSLSNPKLSNKIKTAIFKNILDLDIEHSEDNKTLKLEIDKLLEKSNKYIDNLNKLIVNVSSLATNLEISKKNKPDTNDKINLLIQELAILHQCVAKYVEQYKSLTLLYSEFSANLESLKYDIETLDKNFIEEYTNALHQQYKALNDIIESIKARKLSIEDLASDLSPHLDSEIYSGQVKKITELSNIFSNEDMKNSLEVVEILTCFMRNIIKTNDLIHKNKTIILCDNIKSEFEKLNDKIKKNIIYQKVYGVELPQQNTKELIQQDKVELKALFEKLHKQLDTDIPQYQINKIETLTENLLSEDIVGKEPVIDELLDFLISFLEKNIKDIKSYQSKPYIQKFQENISSFGNFDCPEIEKMLRCYEAFLIPEKSENIKQKNVQQDTSSNKKKPKGKGKKQSVLERKKEQQDALPEEQLVIKEITTPETVEEDPLLLDDSSDFTVVEKKKGKAPKPEALAKEQPVKSDATKHKNVLASKQDKETKGQTVVTKKKSKANKQRKLAPPETLAKDQPVVEPIKTSVVEDPQVNADASKQDKEIKGQTVVKEQPVKSDATKHKTVLASKQDKEIKGQIVVKEQPVKSDATKPEALAKEQPVKSNATKHKTVLASKQDKEIKGQTVVKEQPVKSDTTKHKTVLASKQDKEIKGQVLAKEQPVKSDATKPKTALASKQDKETKGQTVAKKQQVNADANQQRKLAQPETLKEITSTATLATDFKASEERTSIFKAEDFPLLNASTENPKQPNQKTKPTPVAKDQPAVEITATPAVGDQQVKKVTFLDQVLVHEYNSNTNKPEVKNQPIAESIKKPEVENQSVVESIKKPEVKNQPVVEPIKKPEVENQKVGEITATPAVGDKIVAEIIATPAIGGRLFLKQITNSEIALTQVNRTIIYNLNYDLHLIELNDFVNKEYFGSIIENKFLKELSKNFTLKQMGLLLNALYLFNNDNLEKAYYALDCSNSACKEKGSYQSLDKITISKKTGIEKQLQQYLIQRKNIPTKYGVPEKIVLAPEIYGLILSKMSNSDVTIEELSDIIKFHPANLFNLGRLCTTSYILMLEKSLDILDKENSEQASTLRFIALNELLNIGNYLSKKIEKQTINNVKKTSEKIDEDFLLQLKILLVFQKYITEDIYQLMDQDTLDKTINESQIKLLHLMSDVNQKEINSNNQDVETPMHVESSNNIIKSTIAQYKKAYDDYFTSQNNQITEGKEHNFNMIYKFILDNMIQTSFNPHLNYSFNNILITHIGSLILYDKEEHRTKVPLADNVSKKFFFTSSLYMSQLNGKIDKYFEEKKYNINLKGYKYKDYIPQRNIDKLIIEKENFLKMLQEYYSITLKLEYCYNYIKILAVKRNYYSNNLHKNGNENFVKEFNSFYKIRDALYKQNEKIEKLAYEVKQNQDYNREDIHKLEEINNIVLYSDIEHCFHIFHTHNLAFLSHRSAFLLDGKNRQDQVYSDHAYQINEIFKSQKALVNNQVQELLDTASVELEKTISNPALNINAPIFVPNKPWMQTPVNDRLRILALPTEEEIKLMLDPDEEEINTKQTDNISSNIEINKTNTYSGINTTQEPTEDKINTKQTDNTSSNIDTNKTNTYSGINTTQEPTNHDMNITKTSTKQTNGYNGSTIKSRYS